MKKLSRRDFLKLVAIGLGVPGVSFVLTGCANGVLFPDSTSIATVTTTVSKPPIPSETPTPEPTLDTWQKHEKERLRRLGEQGPAGIIPSLEFHGDNMIWDDGSGPIVDMSPAAFKKQMEWLHRYDFHGVSDNELIGFINGTIELPARSIVLSFDLGADAMESIARIVKVFADTDMYGIFTIYTHRMDPNKYQSCQNDLCWGAFRDAYQSGHVSIGSHTKDHQNFRDDANITEAIGLQELSLSKQLIESNIGLGCHVRTLTWPFEAIPNWGPQIITIGLEAGFGGNTYHQNDNAIHKNEPYWYKLPRVLPPNSNGISGRPYPKTLPQMMEMYTSPAKDGVVFED